MDSVVTSIEKKLEELSPIAAECCIYRVPSRLFRIKSTAYTPQIISIGPLHHGNKDLMAMEDHKLRFFRSFLGRENLTVEAAVKEARKWEERARNCYAESINMSSDKFVMMMLVDGCFILELIMRSCDMSPTIEDGLDPLFNIALSTDLYRDLTMLENQLPFFVLQGLFDLQSSRSPSSFLEVAHLFFGLRLNIQSYFPQHVSSTEVRHLVDFLRLYHIPSTPGIQGSYDMCLPPTVTELHEAGVRLEKAEGDKRMVDISFKDGVLEIPPFRIEDTFETYMRNLIAFEHYVDVQYVIPYVSFLDDLINTEKDVSLLIEAQIITNYMGSNEYISRLINDLGNEMFVLPNDYFNNMSIALHDYRRRRRHQWMASLRRDYFNSPWAVVSFFGAVFLILLTLLQTVFSALSKRS